MTERSLELFFQDVPSLRFIGSKKYIPPETPFEVDADVQLVCKYLQAYKLKSDINKGIDKLYKETEVVQFSTDKNLKERQCQDLLQEYTPIVMAATKITQQLFLR